MKPTFPGLHHVTAITAVPQKNIDFYCGTLGLRLVKLTVNFDDPTSYHLYYGDEFGDPGTIMTFFAWAGARRGRIGPPQLTAISFAVSVESLGYWYERLREHRVAAQPSRNRFDEEVLNFSDPDGIRIEIVRTARPGGHVPAGGPIPAEHALRGFHGVTLSEEGHEKTAHLLTEVMGFHPAGNDGNRFRYCAGSGAFASVVDLLCVPDARRGTMGAGVVHHVAFRIPDDAQQEAAWTKLVERGFNVSPVMDRMYFHSIYFREPGGVLFEIATDPPGFTIDEPAQKLGRKLQLPPWLEPDRQMLQEALPQLRVPEWTAAL